MDAEVSDDEPRTVRTSARADARLAVVEEHIRHENQQDLDGILSTFGEHPVYEERAWDERYEGRDGVQTYYETVLQAMPDLSIDVRKSHVTEDAIILEVTISGTHGGHWRGLPPTGRHVEFSLCAVYTFTKEDKLASERIFYDRATVLRQLGIYREPDSLLGRITSALAHPLTVGRAYLLAMISR